MSRSTRVWPVLALLIALIVSACQAAAPPAQPAAPKTDAAAKAPAAQPAAPTTAAQAPAAQPAAPTSAPAAQPKAAAPAGGTLTVARPTDAVGLDPKVETTSPGNWVMSNIYETLVKLDTDLTFKPMLAERWEQLAPDKTRFYLRKGVKFHDGTDFNAEAVKFSIDRQKDKDKPGRSASNLAAIKSVEPVDATTVDVVTDGPYGPLLNIMSLVYSTGVVSPTAVKKFGDDFTRNPVGTGPFQFVEWKTNDSITIKRFDGYWGPAPQLDRIVYKVIPEESARMLALETGDAQVAMSPAPSQIPALKKDNKFTVYEAPGVRVIYFGMITNRAPLDDVKVRQALNFALDRKAIVDNILEGSGSLPQAYISPPIFGFADTSAAWAYDVEKAKRLLDEAGWKEGPDGIRVKDGKKLTLTHASPRGRYLKDAEVSEAFQASMKKIGVDVKLEILEWTKLFDQIRKPNLPYDLFTLGWSTATGDADYTMAPVFGSASIPPAGWNSMEYKNPKFDDLVKKAGQSTNQDERKKLYAEALNILATDAVIVPVYNSLEVIATTSKLDGFKQHPIDYYLWFDKATLKK